jgi:hypothetical protein
MNTGYTIYQVEHTKSAAEQREIDRSNAQLAAAISRLWRVLAPRVSAETSHAIASSVSAETPGHEDTVRTGYRRLRPL